MPIEKERCLTFQEEPDIFPQSGFEVGQPPCPRKMGSLRVPLDKSSFSEWTVLCRLWRAFVLYRSREVFNLMLLNYDALAVVRLRRSVNYHIHLLYI